mmetsp:Transcript_47443/g.120080  ORF Transcript_47443/g.120080 Transcript_47443/m.120080 type:complete len:113 (-) Transcript_47443:397-735(-)
MCGAQQQLNCAMLYDALRAANAAKPHGAQNFMAVRAVISHGCHRSKPCSTELVRSLHSLSHLQTRMWMKPHGGGISSSLELHQPLGHSGPVEAMAGSKFLLGLLNLGGCLLP